MKIYFTFLLCWGFYLHVQAQELITLTESTFKVTARGQKEIYYAFERGDDLIFSIHVLDGKTLKEVEVIAYPEDVKFQDLELSNLKDKHIKVQERGIYCFRFSNSAYFKARLVRFKVQRMPRSEQTQSFNSTVFWEERLDTLAYVRKKQVTNKKDTFQVQVLRPKSLRRDTSIENIVTRTERVHSRGHLTNSNQTSFYFDLPKNQVFGTNKKYVIAWSYAIAVGENGGYWYQDGNKRALARGSFMGAAKLGLISPQVSALAFLAVQGYSLFSNPPKGDNVFFDLECVGMNIPRTLASGNSVAVSGVERNLTQGQFKLSLLNDNLMNGINVSVHVIAVVVTETEEQRAEIVNKVRNRKEVKYAEVPKIKKTKIPYMEPYAP